MSLMIRTISFVVLPVAVLAGRGSRLLGQQAATVSGHVTARGAPLAGARVAVEELKVERTTGSDGAYSFVIPSSNVRGQTVRIVVTADRRLRLAPAVSSIVVTGGPILKDFDLVSGDGAPAPTPGQPQPAPGQPAAPQQIARTVVTSPVIQLGELAGAVDIASALAGRVPGLTVRAASVPGGSALLTFRGQRSILATGQPLYVVDGIIVDNTVFASAAQRFGLGGFDYGSPVGDIDLANVESIRFDGAADAAAMYGGRAANGVVYITTKNGSGPSNFSIISSFQRTGESVGRLPTLQNQYGQGLNGQFQFFNGRGGGVNDGTDQSWGPRSMDAPCRRRATPRRAARTSGCGRPGRTTFRTISAAARRRTSPRASRREPTSARSARSWAIGRHRASRRAIDCSDSAPTCMARCTRGRSSRSTRTCSPRKPRTTMRRARDSTSAIRYPSSSGWAARWIRIRSRSICATRRAAK